MQQRFTMVQETKGATNSLITDSFCTRSPSMMLSRSDLQEKIFNSAPFQTASRGRRASSALSLEPQIEPEEVPKKLFLSDVFVFRLLNVFQVFPKSLVERGRGRWGRNSSQTTNLQSLQTDQKLKNFMCLKCGRHVFDCFL